MFYVDEAVGESTMVSNKSSGRECWQVSPPLLRGDGLGQALPRLALSRKRWTSSPNTTPIGHLDGSTNHWIEGLELSQALHPAWYLPILAPL